LSSSEGYKNFDADFKKSFGMSAVVHILFFSLFFINSFFSKKNTINFSQAIRVDMVGLLDKIVSTELPKAPAKIETKPVEPKPVVEKPVEKVKVVVKEAEKNVVDLKKNKTKQAEALKKLKKLSAIDKIKQEVNNEAQQQVAAKPVILKGRVISAGTALTGLDKLDANTYLQSVDAQVKQNWALPQWLMNKPYRTQVLVKFDSNGNIISRVILKSSSKTSYDNYCLQAVDQAAPFPKVPEKFVEKFSVDGVVIGFPE
jgi:colicin import membrane protein